MIIEYCFGNYRSFKEKTQFSMRATSQTTFNDTLIRDFDERILPSSVIYGANASGKSNIISSLQTFREIVVAGSISNNTPTLSNLELCPFVHDENPSPIFWAIDFANNGKRFYYELQIKVGRLKKDNRLIHYESLSLVQNKKRIPIFTRTENNVQISKESKILDFMDMEDSLVKSLEDKLNDNLDSLELFLSRGFKNTISSDIADIVIDFFSQKLFAVKDFTQQSFNLRIQSEQEMGKNFSIWNGILDSFVKGADFGPQRIFFRKKNDDDDHAADMKLFSAYKNKDTNVFIPAEYMESKGTLKLIDFAIAFQTIFPQGGIFIIDEFDAALHPELVKGIISLFNNPKFNTKGSQLIFTTHNPIYLNNKIFRRDQIRFVEKDKATFQSALYSLADFGSTDVRNDENFLINYFKGKYSTLPYIDFASLLRKTVDNEDV